MIQGRSWFPKCSKSCAFENNFSCLYSQQNAQECYANLTLKAPRVQSGRSSPQIQYSDIVLVGDPPESEREDDGSAEGASVVSELYASVQTQRVKTVGPEGEGEGYANHLWEEVIVGKPHMQFCACWKSTTGWRCGTAAISKQRTTMEQSGLCWLRFVWLDCCSLEICPVLFSLFW